VAAIVPALPSEDKQAPHLFGTCDQPCHLVLSLMCGSVELTSFSIDFHAQPRQW